MPCGFGSLLNTTINKLPFQLNLPGYNYCGPGTRLRERLARGDRGINPLDEACLEHDIVYSQHKELPQRHQADKILAKRARHRIVASDATFGERAAATAVWAAMNAKRKLGMGLRAAVKRKKVLATKKATTNTKRTAKRKIATPTRKRGGFLPLLPLLGAVGALAGGASGIAKAVNDAKAAKKQLEEMQRHNHMIEAATMAGRNGHGLYLTPYKPRSNGAGLKHKAKGQQRTQKRK